MMKIVIDHKAFESKLTLGEIDFEYTKKDGTVRQARGTTKVDLIPEGLRANGGMKATKGTPYFDLDVNDWRSVSTDSDIVTSLQSLTDLHGSPNIQEEEATLMLWKEGKLENEWMNDFITLIHSASIQDAAELMNGKFKTLIRIIKKTQEEPEYSESLEKDWKNLIG